MCVRGHEAACVFIIAALAGAVASLAQTATAPASAPATSVPQGAALPGRSEPTTTSTAPTPPVPLDPRVDQILTSLEQRSVDDLRARVSWRQEYVYDDEDEAVTKRGLIWYQKGKPVARFLVHFDEQITGQRRDKLDERHLFDGQWYVEIQSKTRTVQRREVRRADDRSDPYRLGEGVFPLPFEQRKADILREFEVSRVAPTPQDPPATDHLRLIPRPDSRMSQDYRELHFWVSREGAVAGLPTRVRVGKLDGTGKLNSYITISFAEAQLNAGVSSGIFKIETPAGYTELVEKLDPEPTMSQERAR